jgi:DNA-binding transcriptional MerR regulator
MRIGELSRQTGISQRALRYYEEQGLLRPARRPSGYREYDETDVRTVRRIRVLLAAGLNTAAIAEILPCMPDDGESRTPLCPELLAGLLAERDRISTVIDELGAARTMLETILAAPHHLRSPKPASPDQPANGFPVGLRVGLLKDERTFPARDR